MIHKIVKNMLVMGLTVAMLLQISACGTLLYPERKGGSGGDVDPVVAVADAIVLVFFLIPGVIAFAVDFSNGTIYKSGQRYGTLTPAELQSVSANGQVNKAALSKVMSKKLGYTVNLDSNNLQIIKNYHKADLLAGLNRDQFLLVRR